MEESSGLRGFQDSVWKGIVEAAERRDVNAIVFAGGVLDESPYDPFEQHRNFVYDLADAAHLDGLVVEGTIGKHVSPQRLERFCAR